MKFRLFLLSGWMCAFTATPAFAYIGPGAGIGALGAIIGILAAIFLSVFAIILWPFRKMVRNRKKSKKAPAAADPQPQ